MEDSIFTKIINGEIPCHKIYEDEKTLALLDIYPKNQGHTLVIPKRGSMYVWDLDDEYYQAVMATVKKVALQLKRELPYEYIHSSVVGTDIPYAHVHVVPFDTTDQLHDPDRENTEPDHVTLAQLAEKLRF